MLHLLILCYFQWLKLVQTHQKIWKGKSCWDCPVPQFWWLQASFPECPGKAGVTTLFRCRGDRQTSACPSAWWRRSQPAGPGWAVRPLSQRDLGFVPALRQARPWPQLREAKEENGRNDQMQAKTKKPQNAVIFTAAWEQTTKICFNNKSGHSQGIKSYFNQ